MNTHWLAVNSISGLERGGDMMMKCESTCVNAGGDNYVCSVKV